MRADQITLPLYTQVATGSPALWQRGLRLALLLALAALYGVAMAYLPPQLVVLPMVPIAVLLLLALWLLPDRSTFPERTLVASFTWFIALYYLWPSYIAIALPGLPWFSAGRLGLFVLILVALYCSSISSVFSRRMLETAQASPVIWALLLTELVAQTLATLLTRQPITAASKFANDQMYWTIPFFVGCFIFSKPGRVTSFARTMVIIVVTLSIFGFLEHAQQKLFWEGHIPLFLKVDNDQLLGAVFSGQAREYFGTYRVHSTFSVSLIYAELLVLVLPFVLHWMVMAKTLRLRLTMIAAWLLIVPNIMFTDTRLGKIGFIIAHIGYALMAALRARARKATFATSAAVVAIPVIALMLLSLIFASHTLHSMVFGSEGYAGSTDARYDQLAMGIPKILRNPLGYGAGTSGVVLGYRDPAGLLTIDSQYLKTTLESGVIGMLATYGVFLWAAWLALRMYFTSRDPEVELAGPIALLLMNYVVIKVVLAEDYNNTLGYIAVAMVAALAARCYPRQQHVPGATGAQQRLGRAALQSAQA